jgi:hypothetical protein
MHKEAFIRLVSRNGAEMTKAGIGEVKRLRAKRTRKHNDEMQPPEQQAANPKPEQPPLPQSASEASTSRWRRTWNWAWKTTDHALVSSLIIFGVGILVAWLSYKFGIPWLKG